MAQSECTSFSSDDEQSHGYIDLDCPFCRMEMDGRTTVEGRPTRTLTTVSCRHTGCRKGRAASLLIDRPASVSVERELDARRDQIQRGLSPRRLAGAIRADHEAGEYRIHRIGPHTYEIRGGDNWEPDCAATLAGEIAEIAPHIETNVTATSRAVQIQDSRFESESTTVARPDGGFSPEEAHQQFQHQGPLGRPHTGDYWADRGI
jgi:hypothetical protein